MLVLNANQEQKRVFHDLIQQIDTQVVWNGRFIMMGDRLILEGIVRSLVLHLDIQQAEVKLADLPTEDEKELEITGYPGVQDLITAAVYAFQKWGILDCFQVQQDVKITEREEFDRFMEQGKLTGFGSTDFRPVFAYVEKLREEGELARLKGMIYFTDGYGIYPEQMPDYDVAFVFLQEDENAPKTPPWAIKIVLDEEELE